MPRSTTRGVPHRRVRHAIVLATLCLAAAAAAEGAVPSAGVATPDRRAGASDTRTAENMAAAAGVSRRIYGPAINIDTKSNRRVTRGRLAHRFRATTTSQVSAVLFQARWGSGYSAGDGGRYRISINTDGRSRNHFPSSKRLTELVWSPGGRSGQGQIQRFTFKTRPLLRKGRIYHLVFTNIHPNPSSNYISINEVYTYDRLQPRQPRFRDGIYAVLNGSSGSGADWSVDPKHTPSMDIVYANGRHDGIAYLNSVRADWGAISGANQVRERFTVKGRARRVTGACVRIGRQRGRSPLTIHLERAGGPVIESRVANEAGDVAITRTGADADNGDWVCVRFSRVHRLRARRTYSLRLSAPSDTQYSMTPLLALDSSARTLGYHMRSWSFRAGHGGERSGDGGRTWRSLYSSFPQNMQFYLTLR
jgi:hypothetical protein